MKIPLLSLILSITLLNIAESNRSREKYAMCRQACKLEESIGKEEECIQKCHKQRCRRQCFEKYDEACKQSKACQQLEHCTKENQKEGSCHANFAAACSNEQACQQKKECLMACNRC